MFVFVLSFQRCKTVKACFHYGCALRCVALRGEGYAIETPIVFLFLLPRNATHSRNGNRPLHRYQRSQSPSYIDYTVYQETRKL